VGTTLRELEALNSGRPLRFFGFGWDHGGTGKWREQGTGEMWIVLRPDSASWATASRDPNAREIMGEVTDLDCSAEAFTYLDGKQAEVAGVPCLILRIGFVGEVGYEIHFPAAHGEHLWDAPYIAQKTGAIVMGDPIAMLMPAYRAIDSHVVARVRRFLKQPDVSIALDDEDLKRHAPSTDLGRATRVPPIPRHHESAGGFGALQRGRQGAAHLAEIRHGHHGGQHVSRALTAEHAVIAAGVFCTMVTPRSQIRRSSSFSSGHDVHSCSATAFSQCASGTLRLCALTVMARYGETSP